MLATVRRTRDALGMGAIEKVVGIRPVERLTTNAMPNSMLVEFGVKSSQVAH